MLGKGDEDSLLASYLLFPELSRIAATHPKVFYSTENPGEINTAHKNNPNYPFRNKTLEMRTGHFKSIWPAQISVFLDSNRAPRHSFQLWKLCEQWVHKSVTHMQAAFEVSSGERKWPKCEFCFVLNKAKAQMCCACLHGEGWLGITHQVREQNSGCNVFNQVANKLFVTEIKESSMKEFLCLCKDSGSE